MYYGSFDLLLQIYRRCLDTAQLPDAACIPVAALKAEVLAIVEHEVDAYAQCMPIVNCA